MIPPNPDYPARLDIDYPPQLSRLLIFVKGILVIPHYIALLVLGIGAIFVLFASWWVVLFTGRYPQGMFDYMVGVIRWGHRVLAYQLLMTDAYPPFSLADDPAYPLRIEVDYPPTIARWRPLVHWVLVYPAQIAAGAIAFAGFLATVIAWFAILFTGRYPQGIFRLNVVALRWTMRSAVFQYWMTERYPPFVWA